MTCHQHHTCTPKPRKQQSLFGHYSWAQLCCLCHLGLRGGRSTMTGDTAATEGQASPWVLNTLCLICDDCTSFGNRGAGLELVMAWSTFYLTQRTPHCPPLISTHTYKVCSSRKQLLMSKTFKDLNKLLQNIRKNLCRGNLSVSSKPVWFLLLKIYWNSWFSSRFQLQ